MANTFRLIATYTATSTVSNVVFNSIPNTYQDLKLLVSARSAASQDDERPPEFQVDGTGHGGNPHA